MRLLSSKSEQFDFASRLLDEVYSGDYEVAREVRSVDRKPSFFRSSSSYDERVTFVRLDNHVISLHAPVDEKLGDSFYKVVVEGLYQNDPTVLLGSEARRFTVLTERALSCGDLIKAEWPKKVSIDLPESNGEEAFKGYVSVNRSTLDRVSGLVVLSKMTLGQTARRFTVARSNEIEKLDVLDEHGKKVEGASAFISCVTQVESIEEGAGSFELRSGYRIKDQSVFANVALRPGDFHRKVMIDVSLHPDLVDSSSPSSPKKSSGLSI